MIFSSPIFLFLFFPIVLTVNLLLPGTKARNFWLLLMSLVFYAWGQIDFILLLLASTLINYGFGHWLVRSERTTRRKLITALAVFFNVGTLAFFKYANFAAGLFNSALNLAGIAPIHASTIPLPIGISFFTFHALSYIVDVYRRKWRPATDPKNVALYIFFFPQLIAGPILRWSSIGPQLLQRTISLDVFADGIRRFAVGLAKKVLIANTLAVPADQIFSLPPGELSTPCAWFGLVCYTLQIYFDFSGYSDMAIGMGKMCGFTFMENFHFPYTAQSIRDFWRRWHISLSTWFRDYLYIPLGGNRISETRTYINLITVFCLCGLWHGASLSFVVWGLYHGFFLAAERTRLGSVQEKLPALFRHSYALFVVMMGWVIFRADTFQTAGNYFRALFLPSHLPDAQPLARYKIDEVFWVMVIGILFSGPLWDWIKTTYAKLGPALPEPWPPIVQVSGPVFEILLIVMLLFASFACLAGGTYNPFIYFRF
jgi:alginate O-acetyltransferase complex protein AlgI